MLDPTRPPRPASAPGPRPGDDRSLGDLFSELTSETTHLVRQEIALARTEITADAKTLGRNATQVVAGGAVAYAGVIVLLIGLGFGLGTLLDAWWLGLFLVGLVVAVVGALMARSALETLRNVDPTPERTIQTLKDDAQWLKNQTP